MATRRQLIGLLVAVLAGLTRVAGAQRQAAETPAQFFGFRIGTDGELARYPKVVEYLEHLSRATSRVRFSEIGKTTMGNSYVLATISAPENLARLDRLIEINRRLANPRGLSPAEATKLAQEGRRVLFPLRNDPLDRSRQHTGDHRHRPPARDRGQRRHQADSRQPASCSSSRRRIPTAQVLVIDHWYKTKGTPFSRIYPDLYHKYTGHDDNRDWFMFTQQETRLAVEKIQNVFKPQITHDMHQMGADRGPHLRAAVRRSVRPERPSDPRPGAHRRRSGDGLCAASRKGRPASSSMRATTCGRRRGNTWSITASRAS